ncbi:MAG: hypothetical protein LRY35_00335 [Clostridiales bacterium]|nr:hypothetical protein [Clostridiales bacterium]
MISVGIREPNQGVDRRIGDPVEGGGQENRRHDNQECGLAVEPIPQDGQEGEGQKGDLGQGTSYQKGLFDPAPARNIDRERNLDQDRDEGQGQDQAIGTVTDPEVILEKRRKKGGCTRIAGDDEISHAKDN